MTQFQFLYILAAGIGYSYGLSLLKKRKNLFTVSANTGQTIETYLKAQSMKNKTIGYPSYKIPYDNQPRLPNLLFEGSSLQFLDYQCKITVSYFHSDPVQIDGEFHSQELDYENCGLIFANTNNYSESEQDLIASHVELQEDI